MTVNLIRRTFLRFQKPAMLFTLGLSLFSTGCSDDSLPNTISTSFPVSVTIGQGDFSNTQIRAILINDTGDLRRLTNGRLSATDSETSALGATSINLSSSTNHAFFANGFNNSSRRCQLVAGCEIDSNSVSFSQTFELLQAPNWRSYVDAPASGQQIVISPLTELAAAIAESLNYVYAESDPNWRSGGSISSLSIRQGLEQVSALFGVTQLQSTLPVDLTQINSLGLSSLTQNAVVYGAVIAAWQASELQHSATAERPYFHNVIIDELLSDSADCGSGEAPKALGQICITTRNNLLDAAEQNLQALLNSGSLNATATDAVANAIVVLDGIQASNASDSVTSAAPSSLDTLLSSAELSEFNSELDDVKTFATDLSDLLQAATIDANLSSSLVQYQGDLINYGKDTANQVDEFELIDPLDDFLAEVVAAYLRYRRCINDGCNDEEFNASTKTLGINEVDSDKQLDLTLTQQAVDLAGNAAGSSRFIDVIMVGEIALANGNKLTFVPISETDTGSRTALRVFQDIESSELVDSAADKALAYEIIWSDFDLEFAPEFAPEEKLSGDLAIFYAQVSNPVRYTISDFSLEATRTDSNAVETTINITSESSFKGTLTLNRYPDPTTGADSEFAVFEGLINPTTVGSSSDSADMLDLSRGEITINGENVVILDVVSNVSEFAQRYRFYPTKTIRDRRDDDRDNDTRDLVVVNDVEICKLGIAVGGNKTVDSCQPKQRLLDKNNVEQVIDEILNERWLSGELSVFNSDDGRRLVAQWPITGNSDLGQTCFNLTGQVFDDVVSGSGSVDGQFDSMLKQGLRELDLVTNIALSAPTDTSSVRVNSVYNDVDPVNFAYRVLDNLDNMVVKDDLVINYRGNPITTSSSSNASTTMASRVVFEQEDIQLRLSNDDSVIGLSSGAPVFPFVYLLNGDGSNEACVTSPGQLRDEPLVLMDEGIYIIQDAETVYATLTRINDSLVITFADGQTISL